MDVMCLLFISLCLKKDILMTVYYRVQKHGNKRLQGSQMTGLHENYWILWRRVPELRWSLCSSNLPVNMNTLWPHPETCLQNELIHTSALVLLSFWKSFLVVFFNKNKSSISSIRASSSWAPTGDLWQPHVVPGPTVKQDVKTLFSCPRGSTRDKTEWETSNKFSSGIGNKI